MTEPEPARFDRGQLERIIRRAAMLQTGEHEVGDDLSRDDVLKLGREVGIPTRYLDQAMIEERVRAADGTMAGLWDRSVGPATVRAMRVVRGTPEGAQRTLIRWLDEHELLAVAREQPGRVLWEPVGGFHAAMRRAGAVMGGVARPFMLARSRRVTATITALEDGYCHVTLEADIRKTRDAMIGGAAALVVVGGMAAAILTVLHAFLPLALIPLPFGFVGGWAVLRGYPPVLARTQLGLDRALDALEQDTPTPAALPSGRPGLLDAVLGEVRKAIK
ncbi:MAG TPA: hypothetical protein VFI39_12460 [Gemmatimonadales bacterium]|nr:hypothetical protein [Gemmatimonadales bacterium]